MAKPKHQHSDVKQAQIDEEFMRGFGVALASIWRLHHDGQMVEHVLKSNGFKLESFDDVELTDGDRNAIRAALGKSVIVCPRCHLNDDLVEATNYGRPTGRKHCRRCNLTLEPEAA